MSCDGSGHAIGCPGCQLCRPLPATDNTPPPPLNDFAADVWERVSRELDEQERRYAASLPAY